MNLYLAAFVLLSCALYSAEGYGRYDLSPEDVKALCKVVDGVEPAVEPPRCIYYKWITCDGDPGTADRPCGWYQQTECSNKRRKKRGAPVGLGEPEPERSANPGPAYITWPDLVRK